MLLLWAGFRFVKHLNPALWCLGTLGNSPRNSITEYRANAHLLLWNSLKKKKKILLNLIANIGAKKTKITTCQKPDIFCIWSSPAFFSLRARDISGWIMFVVWTFLCSVGSGSHSPGLYQLDGWHFPFLQLTTKNICRHFSLPHVSQGWWWQNCPRLKTTDLGPCYSKYGPAPEASSGNLLERQIVKPHSRHKEWESAF